MALTRLGWDVYTSSSNPNLVSSSWITGKVRGGDHKIVLDEIARRWNAEVEKIDQASSWGYNYRAVRGATVVSEHAAGVANDYNAPKHPLGVAGTFTAAQVRAIHKIQADLGYVFRWGGDYRHANGDPRRPISNPKARVDEMHIELQGGNALVSKIAAKIKAGGAPTIVSGGKGTAPVVTKPAASKPTTKTKAYPNVNATLATRVASWRYLLGACGYTGSTAVRRQKWLRKLGYYKRAIDGKSGYYTILAEQKFLRKKGFYAKAYRLDGRSGPATKKAELAYLNSQRKYL